MATPTCEITRADDVNDVAEGEVELKGWVLNPPLPQLYKRQNPNDPWTFVGDMQPDINDPTKFSLNAPLDPNDELMMQATFEPPANNNVTATDIVTCPHSRRARPE